MKTTPSHKQATFVNLASARFVSGFQTAGIPFPLTPSDVHFSNPASQTHLMVQKTKSDPFTDDDRMESIVDEEGAPTGIL